MIAFPTTYPLFILSALALLLVPGPAVLYILARSVHQGRTIGLISAAGLGVGNFIQALAATAGLSVMLASSPVLFNLVKTAGAAYLILIGVRTLLRKDGSVGPENGHPPSTTQRSLWQAFREGLIINTLNPKVALFFLAFLPQFVDPGSESSARQIFLLGTSFAVLGVLTDSLYALVAGSLGSWLKRQPHFHRLEQAAAGSIYILLGFGALLVQPGKAL